MPLDISMMKPEPFPYSVMMRPDLHPKRQPSGEEGWRGRLGAVCGAVQTLVRQCRAKAERVLAGRRNGQFRFAGIQVFLFHKAVSRTLAGVPERFFVAPLPEINRDCV